MNLYGRYRAWVTNLPKSAQYFYGASLTAILLGGYVALTFGTTIGLITAGAVFVGVIILSNLFAAMLGEGSGAGSDPGRSDEPANDDGE